MFEIASQYICVCVCVLMPDNRTALKKSNITTCVQNRVYITNIQVLNSHASEARRIPRLSPASWGSWMAIPVSSLAETIHMAERQPMWLKLASVDQTAARASKLRAVAYSRQRLYALCCILYASIFIKRA